MNIRHRVEWDTRLKVQYLETEKNKGGFYAQTITISLYGSVKFPHKYLSGHRLLEFERCTEDYLIEQAEQIMQEIIQCAHIERKECLRLLEDLYT